MVLKEFLKHSKESRGVLRQESKQAGKKASKQARGSSGESSREPASKQLGKQGRRQGSKEAGKQAGKQASSQASKQSSKQALRRHSVGAMPCRGLLCLLLPDCNCPNNQVSQVPKLLKETKLLGAC